MKNIARKSLLHPDRMVFCSADFLTACTVDMTSQPTLLIRKIACYARGGDAVAGPRLDGGYSPQVANQVWGLVRFAGLH